MPPRKRANALSPQDLIPADDQAGPGASFATDAYNKAARSAQLRVIQLSNSQFNMTSVFLKANRTPDGKPKLAYASTMEAPFFDPEKGVAGCAWKWSVTAKVERVKVLTIEATYRLGYDGLDGCEEDAVFRFMARVGRFAAYPYFRAHVSQVSWESGAALPIMPAIHT